MCDDSRPELVHVVIGDVSPRLLENIVAELTEMNSALHLADRSASGQSVSRLIAKHGATVAIIPLDPSSYPSGCTRLLDEFESLALVGISENGRRAAIFVQDIGIVELMETLQATGGHAGRKARSGGPVT